MKIRFEPRAFPIGGDRAESSPCRISSARPWMREPDRGGARHALPYGAVRCRTSSSRLVPSEDRRYLPRKSAHGHRQIPAGLVLGVVIRGRRIGSGMLI